MQDDLQVPSLSIRMCGTLPVRHLAIHLVDVKYFRLLLYPSKHTEAQALPRALQHIPSYLGVLQCQGCHFSFFRCQHRRVFYTCMLTEGPLAWHLQALRLFGVLLASSLLIICSFLLTIAGPLGFCYTPDRMGMDYGRGCRDSGD